MSNDKVDAQKVALLYLLYRYAAQVDKAASLKYIDLAIMEFIDERGGSKFCQSFLRRVRRGSDIIYYELTEYSLISVFMAVVSSLSELFLINEGTHVAYVSRQFSENVDSLKLLYNCDEAEIDLIKKHIKEMLANV